jgi:CDP-glucose 4,6-dehydratase
MNFWSHRNVFVTGATGLLGSWLVEGLLERGARVTCLIRDWVPRGRLAEAGLLARVNVVHGELEDYPTVVRALNEYEIDGVFHLGAQTIVGTASRSALSTFEANVRGTWNLLEACRSCQPLVQRILVASSDKAYGHHVRLPYTEETPLRGRFPYDVSKVCADLIAQAYYHTYRLPVAITRCGNLYGGGDLNFNRLIPGTIRSAFQNEPPLIRSNGKFVRDYFYVCDAAEAYLCLAEQMGDDRLWGQAFNLGTETPLSVLDLVQQILALMGKAHLEPRVLNEATHEIPEQYLDCSRARQLLRWASRFTLEQGLRETIAWYQDWLTRPAGKGPDHGIGLGEGSRQREELTQGARAS